MGFVGILFVLLIKFSKSKQVDISDITFQCNYSSPVKLSDTTKMINGLTISNRLTTYHQELELLSDDFQIYMNLLWKLLYLFHTFAEDNSVLYTLQGGSIVGWYRDEKQLFFDDDLDILVREKDFHYFSDWWKRGNNEVTYHKHERQVIEFIGREFELYGVKLEIIKAVDYDGWFKVRLRDKKSKSFKYLGGIDIDRCVFDGAFCNDTYAIKFRNKKVNTNFDFPRPDAKEVNYPRVKFCGVETRMAKWDVVKGWFERKYPYWERKVGPLLLREKRFGEWKRYKDAQLFKTSKLRIFQYCVVFFQVVVMGFLFYTYFYS